jgi:glycosyltransferase involved in cell wall biosynthesis
LTDDNILILSIGRITRDKGIFELVNSVALATAQDPRITCVIIGSLPAVDETASVQSILNQAPCLKQHVRLLPACSPEKVWEFLCAADIFAFASHHDGMPNSLLEAMAMGVPAIAFAIPPVLEIEAGTGALTLVPPFDTSLFAQAIIRLAASSDDRVHIGEKGRNRVMDGFQVQKNMAQAFQRLTQMVQQHS